MNISGPLSISPVSASQHPELDLRPFQRVTAQVLSVTGTTALLTIEGYPVVAQLASADQAATLLPQQTAQFIVTGRTSQKITLKVVGDEQPPASLARSAFQGPELAVRLLEQYNIPLTANHLVIARAILKQHLPLSPLLINEFQEILSAYGTWGNKEAQLMAALKAAGLPLNAQSLALASRQAAQIGDSVTRLIAKLTDMTEEDLPEALLEQFHFNLHLLNSLVLRVDREPSQLAEQLKSAVKTIGRSLENVVLQQLQNSQTLLENNLLSLVNLQHLLEQEGKNELASMLNEFLRDLQLNQFLNAKPEAPSVQGDWAEISFPLQHIQQKADEGFPLARLRIARETSSDSSKINPAYTRLTLQVELRSGETVEVDLSIVDKQIRALVTAPDELWRQQAQEEFPTLEQALQGLGFALKDGQIGVGKPQSFDQLSILRDAPLMTVDIEA